MCRFILVQSKKPIKPRVLLTRFANMAEKSKALDGDWQGDGYGIAWVNKHGKWQVKKSLSPVWEDLENFNELGKTDMFIAHARSASFPQHKGVIEFNQPYISEKFAFVFNGLLKGVSLQGVPGEIGAEKIWFLLQQELEHHSPQYALEKIKTLLIKSSNEIVALNMGLATSDEIYSLCYFTRNPEYYQLYKYNSSKLNIVCSEYIENILFDWENIDSVLV